MDSTSAAPAAFMGQAVEYEIANVVDPKLYDRGKSAEVVPETVTVKPCARYRRTARAHARGPFELLAPDSAAAHWLSVNGSVDARPRSLRRWRG